MRSRLIFGTVSISIHLATLQLISLLSRSVCNSLIVAGLFSGSLSVFVFSSRNVAASSDTNYEENNPIVESVEFKVDICDLISSCKEEIRRCISYCLDIKGCQYIPLTTSGSLIRIDIEKSFLSVTERELTEFQFFINTKITEWNNRRKPNSHHGLIVQIIRANVELAIYLQQKICEVKCRLICAFFNINSCIARATESSNEKLKKEKVMAIEQFLFKGLGGILSSFREGCMYSIKYKEIQLVELGILNEPISPPENSETTSTVDAHKENSQKICDSSSVADPVSDQSSLLELGGSNNNVGASSSENNEGHREGIQDSNSNVLQSLDLVFKDSLKKSISQVLNKVCKILILLDPIYEPNTLRPYYDFPDSDLISKCKSLDDFYTFAAQAKIKIEEQFRESVIWRLNMFKLRIDIQISEWNKRKRKKLSPELLTHMRNLCEEFNLNIEQVIGAFYFFGIVCLFPSLRDIREGVILTDGQLNENLNLYVRQISDLLDTIDKSLNEHIKNMEFKLVNANIINPPRKSGILDLILRFFF